MITVKVTGRHAVCQADDPITTGSIGMPVQFYLNAAWKELAPVAVFRADDVSVDIVLIGGSCTVPPEVLQTAGSQLWVGVYGRNAAGTIAIPTIWAAAGTIRPGTEPGGVDPAEPTPDWTAQVQQIAADAMLTAQAAEATAAEADERSQAAVTSADAAISQAAKTLSAAQQAARDAAADSAAAGTIIRGFQSTANNVLFPEQQVATNPDGKYSINTNGIYVATGLPFDSTKYCRTNLLNCPAARLLKLDLSDYEWHAWCYSGTTWATRTHSATDKQWISGDNPIYIRPVDNDVRYAVCIRRKDLATLTTDLSDPDSDFAKIRAAFAVFRPEHPDSTLSEPGKAADAAACGALKDTITEQSSILSMADSVPVPFVISGTGYVNNADGSIGSSEVRSYTDYVDISKYKRITYKQLALTSSNPTSGTSFYDADKNFVCAIPSLKNQSNVGYANNTCDVPNNAVYARFTLHTDAETYGDFSLSGESRLSYAVKLPNGSIPLGLHTMPANQGVLNCIKRARQLTDIRWTPKYNLPYRICAAYQMPDGIRPHYHDTFAAGISYRGIPYSYHAIPQCIGQSASLEAFVTALCCPHSVEYEDSAYDTAHWDRASYYGVVCSVFVTYALNYPITAADKFDNIPYMASVFGDDVTIADVTDADLDSIELCDVLASPTHVALVTDVIRDSDFHVSQIEISEATTGGRTNWDDVGAVNGGTCRRRMWHVHTVPAVGAVGNLRATWGTFRVLRYSNLAAIPYHPSIYSPMVDEGDCYPVINYPVLPRKGNRAIYSTIGSGPVTVRLIVNMRATQDADGQALPDITHVIVKRNGEAYGEPVEIQSAEDGMRYADVVHNANDEAIYTAQIAAYAGDGEYLSYLSACSWATYGGSVLPSSNIPADSNRQVTISITRQTELYYPYAISFGRDADNNGSINGKSANIYDYTVSETEDGYVYTFAAIVPVLNKAPSTVPFVVHLRNDDYGTRQVSSISVSPNVYITGLH